MIIGWIEQLAVLEKGFVKSRRLIRAFSLQSLYEWQSKSP